MKKAKKYAEYLITKMRVVSRQKKYIYDNTAIRYMFENQGKKDLIIVFGSCTRKGIKARYNYVRTLKNMDLDQLFILDDYGFDGRGIYYLGKDMDFFVERAVSHLINRIASCHNYRKMIFAGSSKGGYGALNFGLLFPGSSIIAGAPQYHLGSYLMDPDNHLEDTLKYITGKTRSNISQTVVKDLDSHLCSKIQNYKSDKSAASIYLHYSREEHTYQEHIKDLIKDLKENGFYLQEDAGEYKNHSDVSLYFPDYLKKSVQLIIDREECHENG